MDIIYRRKNVTKIVFSLLILWSIISASVWIFTNNVIIFLICCLVPFGVLFVITFPFFLTILFLVFSFFRIHEAFPFLLSLKLPLLLSLGSIVSFYYSFLLEKITPYWDKAYIPFVTFFTLVTIGTFFAMNKTVAINYWKDVYVKIFIMVFIISWIINSKARLKSSIIYIVSAGMTIALVAIKNKLNGVGLVEGTRVTISRDIGSFLGDPNDLSLALLMPLGFTFAIFLNKDSSKKFRLFALIGACLIILAIIYTQSRGGLLGVMSVVGIFAVRRIKSKLLLMAGGAGLCLVLFFAAGISDRKSGGSAEEGLDQSASVRLHAWETAFMMGLKNPITGVGVNNFLSNYYFFTNHWDGKNHAVHSTWFGVIAESGFVGFSVFVWMITVIIRSILKSLKTVEQKYNKDSAILLITAESLLSSIVSFIVSGTFLTQGFLWTIYILLTLTIVLKKYISTNL